MELQEILTPSKEKECDAEDQRVASTSAADTFSTLVPVPINVAQTHLPPQLLKELLLKHVFARTVVSTRDLSDSLALSGGVVDELVHSLRQDALLELSSAGISTTDLNFRLTERGQAEARIALSKSGYAGPSPVSLQDYQRVVEHFSILKYQVTRGQVGELFQHFVIEDTLLDRLGTAMNSHRPIFIYGPAGTGKTYTTRRLCKLYSDSCLIPHALAIGDAIVPVFNAQLHTICDQTTGQSQSLRYAEAYDKRFVPCERPVIVTGGELTLDQLDVAYTAETRAYQAPLQLMANNGLFIIDDMGRQAVSPKAIFNRWIVPMEEGRDFLSLNNGQHFEAPFNVQLVFSANIHPHELADEAFLRRIGFKVKFDHLTGEDYAKIWQQELHKAGLEYDPELISYLIECLHARHGVPMAACHPRDLLNTALSQIDYLSGERVLTRELMAWAWSVYFVPLDE